ncbi:hypothetical protein UA75_10090 [Actinoalloteichus sp. GBA129-24]|uniref:Uncharacterized protein n=1 Tax=Actinoalloteichus fjordicus TaxID=1612552 RepID=A0AAC9LAQ2_9PSEU|nr:hypothetical protein UA74_10115 [Actinoalloteichus fjordicus]APU20033.1 hypothetical protein UA75_10090 [Actinoalloteichus sp. GBA129-24]
MSQGPHRVGSGVIGAEVTMAQRIVDPRIVDRSSASRAGTTTAITVPACQACQGAVGSRDGTSRGAILRDAATAITEPW